MRRFTIACLLGLCALASSAFSFEIELSTRFGDAQSPAQLRILSSTDLDRFQPVISEFLNRNPKFSITYVTASTSEIYKAIAEEKQKFDLVISSAMDLQIKLANDGFTQTVPNVETKNVPAWARWRHEVFGFALEPVVLLVSRRDFADLEPPKTRRDLLTLIRNNPTVFQNRIGAYDPDISGAGYLFSTQDARQSDTFWRLAEVMGRVGTKLYCCTSHMIRAVNTGELALAYNVLGSYANATLPAGSNAKVITLQDYTHILLRTAVIPNTAQNFSSGQAFLNFLISDDGQSILDQKAKLPALNNSEIAQLANRKPIRLDSGLLVFLDRLKKQSFLSEWDAALIQN